MPHFTVKTTIIEQRIESYVVFAKTPEEARRLNDDAQGTFKRSEATTTNEVVVIDEAGVVVG